MGEKGEGSWQGPFPNSGDAGTLTIWEVTEKAASVMQRLHSSAAATQRCLRGHGAQKALTEF